MTAQPTGRTREAADGTTEHEYRSEGGTCFWAVPAVIYAFCESVHAGPRSPWHIRRVPAGASLKPGGGIQTGSLCGSVSPRQGWDLPNITVDERHLEFACRTCAAEYRDVTRAPSK